MGQGMPLTSLLSQVLAALTIEADDEVEHRLPHVTTDGGASPLGPGPWLISAAMYLGFLRFVPDDGIRMADLAASAGLPAPVHPSYHGMRRWGYVTYAPDIAGSAPRARDGDAVVTPTPAGRRARTTWGEVLVELEERWTERGLGSLREVLVPVGRRIARPLPEGYPTLGYGYRLPPLDAPVSRPAEELGTLALLAQVSLAMSYDVEATSAHSLALCADLLRPLGTEPVAVRDLPTVSGVAKIVWGSAIRQLGELGLLVAEPLATGRGKAVRLTPEGLAALDDSRRAIEQVEARWQLLCGSDLARLRGELEVLVGDGSSGNRVFEGLGRHADGWRAGQPAPRVLPHQPLVSHRGGYPDGS